MGEFKDLNLFVNESLIAAFAAEYNNTSLCDIFQQSEAEFRLFDWLYSWFMRMVTFVNY